MGVVSSSRLRRFGTALYLHRHAWAQLENPARDQLVTDLQSFHDLYGVRGAKAGHHFAFFDLPIAVDENRLLFQAWNQSDRRNQDRVFDLSEHHFDFRERSGEEPRVFIRHRRTDQQRTRCDVDRRFDSQDCRLELLRSSVI
jgi:hypothetical protein